jgi:uncharacterized membrane protein
MNTNNDPVRWIFKKNCSFTPKQVGLFYLAQSVFSLIVASFFLIQGIWLILPFTLLELIVLGFALLIYAKHATDYEEIMLNHDQLVITHYEANKLNTFVANLLWVKLSKKPTEKKLIGIEYKGQLIEIGRFIHLHKRDEFRSQLAHCIKTMI